MRVFLYACVFFALAGNSDAGLIMSFTPDGTSQPLTIINVGQTTTLDVYLLQTDGEFDTSPYDAGLINGGVRLNFGPEVQVTAFAADAAWEDSSLEPAPPPISGYADLLTGVLFSLDPVLPDSNAIKIGTVTFQGAAPGLATITFEDPAGADLFVLDGGTVIDASVDFSSNAAQIQVNGEAIPEPSSVALSLLVFGAVSVVTTCRARRRRKQRATSEDRPVAASSL